MNTSKNVGVVELLLLAAMALAWATCQVVRLTVVPVVALLLVLLTPRRRPAPQPAAQAPVVASPEAVEPEPAAVAAEPALATIGADLLALPAAQLRHLAGTRRRLPKAQLIAMVCAMPL